MDHQSGTQDANFIQNHRCRERERKRLELTFVALKQETQKWRRRRRRVEEGIGNLQNSLLTLCFSSSLFSFHEYETKSVLFINIKYCISPHHSLKHVSLSEVQLSIYVNHVIILYFIYFILFLDITGYRLF